MPRNLHRSLADRKSPPPEMKRIAELANDMEDIVREATTIGIRLGTHISPVWLSGMHSRLEDVTRQVGYLLKAACLAEDVERRTGDQDRGIGAKEAAQILGLSPTEVRRMADKEPAALGVQRYGKRLVLSKKQVHAYARRTQWASGR